MPINIEKIIYNTTKSLKNRSIIGVKKSQAVIAIENAVHTVQENYENLLTYNDHLNQKYFNIQADKLKQKNVIIDSLNKQLINYKLRLIQLKKQAHNLKTITKILPNGNTEIRKVNKNGVMLIKEITPDGKKVSNQISTLAGDYRKTTYNLITSQPIKTTTNVNGGKFILYNQEHNAPVY